ncbi:reverse transcriptase domain-containing protein [Tanacetum coccineum]|uniref:Reverse transcriptase domain-containing protein n=1 Tax=Tanacetum coccineum TaxID=301880 RepID=A0ABQ5CTG4_9ASTR
MIVRSPSPYNGIIGRPGIREIQAVPSTSHGMLKFPVDGVVVTIRSTILMPNECATITETSKDSTKKIEGSQENVKVAIHHDFPDQAVALGGTLSIEGWTTLCGLLKRNLDIFAWQPSDMTGVPRQTVEHRLNIRDGYPPVQQKKRGQAPERAKAIQAEVQKLVKAGIMREVYYHDWLSNPVMVKKHDGSWRMCVDFTNLNKAYPQDCYPLPEIGWKVESLCGYPFKCFLDAYKGYHQIQMAKEDEEKTAFHTPHGVYCYTKMPFGLKNAEATYQRLVDKAFEKQVGRNLEVYVDDLVIKSHTEAELLRDIEETFRTLRKINMKLNPKKCTFGAVEGMFLGYMIGPEGIKPCPEKIEAVLQLPSLRTIKEVQSLNGKLAGLNRFLSKSAEKSLPLFKTLKKCVKKSDFRWTPEAEQAFKQLKHHISELPMLVAPRPKEELIMYLSASQGAVGAVLMTERDSIQTLVYFVSRALQGPELNYTPMEKLVLALVFAAKRLRRYFQAHPIAVITDQPIRQVMSRPEVAGRLQKWSIMLGEHNITYRPRTSVKGQILTDFLVEKPEEASADMSEKEIPPEGAEFTYALRFQFTASNNEAEYEALLAGLRIAAQMGVRNIRVSVDSKLVANQVLGTYIAKEENMIKYLEKFRAFIKTGPGRGTPRKVHPRARGGGHGQGRGPNLDNTHNRVPERWGPPGRQEEASKLRIKARQYELMDGILYRRSFLRPWLRCVGPLQADYVIREIHEGSCSMHAGPRSVVAKAMRSGYYWPTMHRDARDMILKCKDCQVHRPVPRNPQQPLTPITSPWPFYKWGIDIAGPFPEGPGKVKFLIVAMDYFTKWIEAKAVATISGGQVKKFVWDNIVCRFGLPGEIVSDNGKQFSDNPFKDWCEKLNITQRFASVKHPQSNGLVERANRSLGEGIKARLGEGNKNWIEEIPHVLWAHRTMIKSSNGDTPFSLTYGTEAVIPAEIGMPTYRTAAVDIVRNDDEIRLNLDLVEERREQAAIREAKAKSKMMRYYNARVRGVTFKPGDYVYRSNEASHAMDGGKLGPKWEGPYEVTEVLGGGAYKLRSMDGAVLPRTWNIANLKKCYL